MCCGIGIGAESSHGNGGLGSKATCKLPAGLETSLTYFIYIVRSGKSYPGRNHPRIVDQSELQGLIDSWELVHVEFKSRHFLESLSGKRRRDLAATLASLANRHGGYLVIGVDDQSRQIEPGSFDQKDVLVGKIAHVNRDLCSPPTEISHEFVTCSEGEVLVIIVGRRGPIPHAVVKRAGGEIEGRTYYIRNNQGKQLVADTELRQMFLNRDFPNLKTTFPFVFAYDRSSLRELSFEDLPSRTLTEMVFTVGLRKAGPVGKDELDTISRLVAELFPYAVLSTMERSFSAGWGSRIRPAGLGVVVEPTDEPSSAFGPDRIPRPPQDSHLARAIPDFKEFAESMVLFFQDLLLPPNTDMTIEYPEPGNASSRLILQAGGIYRITIGYRGGAWGVGLPPGHPLEMSVGSRVLKADDPLAWVLGHVEMEFDLGLGNFSERMRADYYEWAGRLFEILESELSWNKFIGRLPDPYLLRVDRNVRRLLEALDSDHDSNRKSK